MESKNDKIRAIIKSVISSASNMSTFGVKLKYNNHHILSSIDKLEGVTKVLNEKFGTVVNEQMEIVASSENIASLLESTSSNVEKVNKSATENTSSVEIVTTKMKDLKDKNQYVESQMDSLDGIIHEIYGAIKNINQISVQSRMLSINASIEAARAGVSGKGFAVVAQEMQTLSKNTDKFVSVIDSLLSSIKEYSSSTKSSLKESTNGVEHMENMLIELTHNIQNTGSSMDEITENIKDISVITENFSNTTQTTTQTIDECVLDINIVRDTVEQFQNIYKSLAELETQFLDVEKSSSKSSHMITEMDDYPEFKLTNEDFIQILESAIVAHKNWVKTVQEMEKTKKVLPLQTDGHKCGFGHYYYVLKPKNKSILDIWKSIEIVHNDLHSLGGDIIKYIEKSDLNNVKVFVSKAVSYSEEIIKKLDSIISITQHENTLGNNVFSE